MIIVSVSLSLIVLPDSYTIVITDGLGPNGKLTLTRSILTLFVKLDDNGVQYTCKAIHPAIPRPLVNTMSISVLGNYLHLIMFFFFYISLLLIVL